MEGQSRLTLQHHGRAPWRHLQCTGEKKGRNRRRRTLAKGATTTKPLRPLYKRTRAHCDNSQELGAATLNSHLLFRASHDANRRVFAVSCTQCLVRYPGCMHRVSRDRLDQHNVRQPHDSDVAGRHESADTARIANSRRGLE